MGILFIWYRRTIFINLEWFHVLKQRNRQHNSNSNIGMHRQKSSTYGVVACFRINSYLTSSAAQYCIAYYTKQTKQTHKPRDYYLLIDRYRYQYRQRSHNSHIPYVHTFPFPCYFTAFTPPTHSNFFPLFRSFFSFLFLPFLPSFSFVFPTPHHTVPTTNYLFRLTRQYRQHQRLAAAAAATTTTSYIHTYIHTVCFGIFVPIFAIFEPVSNWHWRSHDRQQHHTVL